MARFVDGESLKGARQLFQRRLVVIDLCAARVGLLGFLANKIHQLDQIRRPQFDERHIAIQFLGHESNRRAYDHELLLVEAQLVQIAKPAAHLGRFPQRLVEVLQMENRGVLENGDKVERLARA